MNSELIKSKIMSVEKVLTMQELSAGIYEKYRNYDFESEYWRIKNGDYRHEYSKGGLGFPFGIYAPEKFTENIVANCTVGRKTLHPEKGYNFKYYFRDGKIILYEKVNESGELIGLKFAFYEGSVETIINISVHNRWNPFPLKVYECYRYEFDSLGRVIHGLLSRPFSGSGEITHIEELFFDYKDDNIQEIIEYVYTAHWLMGGRGQSKLPMSVGGRLYTMRGKELLDCKKLENFIKL